MMVAVVVVVDRLDIMLRNVILLLTVMLEVDWWWLLQWVTDGEMRVIQWHDDAKLRVAATSGGCRTFATEEGLDRCSNEGRCSRLQRPNSGRGFREGQQTTSYQLGVLQALLTVTDRLTVFLSLQILQMTSSRSFFSEGRIHGPPRLLPKSSKIGQTPVWLHSVHKLRQICYIAQFRCRHARIFYLSVWRDGMIKSRESYIFSNIKNKLSSILFSLTSAKWWPAYIGLTLN